MKSNKGRIPNEIARNKSSLVRMEYGNVCGDRNINGIFDIYEDPRQPNE